MAFFRNWGRLVAGNFLGGWKRVLSRFTWELPQTLLGGWVGSLALLVLHVDEVSTVDGIVVIRGWNKVKCWGGICFGSVILGDERIQAQVNNNLFMHEFGHVLQSRSSGPIYLFKYGIPSVLSAKGNGIHSDHPVERDANQRACSYFSDQTGFTTWPAAYNPLPADNKLLILHWWEFLPPVFPLRHLWIAFRDRNGLNLR